MPDHRATLETVARRWIEEIWRPGDLATFDELHAPDFRDRSAAGRGDTREDPLGRLGLALVLAKRPLDHHLGRAAERERTVHIHVRGQDEVHREPLVPGARLPGGP